MSLATNQIYRLLIILILLASFTPVSLVSKSAECTMADSQMIFFGRRASIREVDAEKIREILEDKVVAEKLRSSGLSKEEIMSKMAKMTDGQIHQM
jgi:hypothetical protein